MAHSIWLRVVAVFLIGAATLTAAAAADSDKPPVGKEHSFGTKALIVAIRLPGTRANMESRVLEKARITQLGDRYFLVGVVPDLGTDFKFHKGSTYWIPLSEVVSFSEFDSLDAVKKVYEAQQKALRSD